MKELYTALSIVPGIQWVGSDKLFLFLVLMLISGIIFKVAQHYFMFYF